MSTWCTDRFNQSLIGFTMTIEIYFFVGGKANFAQFGICCNIGLMSLLGLGSGLEVWE